MIIAATLSSQQATYFHVTDSETLAVIGDLLRSAVILEEAKGFNGTCRALIVRFEKNTLVFKGGEEVQTAKIFLDEPVGGHSKDEVMAELEASYVMVLPKRQREEEVVRAPLEKAPGQSIILMRHSLHKNDVLTINGEEVVRQRATELRYYGNFKIVSTPAVRCVQTARLLAAELGLLATTVDHKDIVKLVANSPETSWLIVSHQPTIEEWSGDLGGYFSPEMGEFKIF